MTVYSVALTWAHAVVVIRVQTGGDWYFPSGDRLQFSALNVVYEHRAYVRVDLRRNGNADTPSGIYRCDIETNAVNSNDDDTNTDRETVYAGIYATGGKLTLLLQLH